ncbi:MAG: hypothetical protein AAB365_01830 [Patescibacteria group bacterium]
MDSDIYKQQIDFYTLELEKIGKILSDQTAGTGTLLTIVGLLSFLPQLLITNNEYISYFLLWTFWILIIAIATYWPASLRVSSIVKGHPFASTGSSLEIEILKNRNDYFDIVWKKSVENHDAVLFWNSVSKSLLYAYLFSLVSNFYVFVFHGTPDFCTSLTLLTISVIIALLLFWIPRMKSQKGRVIGDK